MNANPLRKALLPFVPLYRMGLGLRAVGLRSKLERVRRLRSPVVSIGNLSMGGSGKTPLTIALAQALAERGFQVDVLSRGYGRQSNLPARVDPAGTAEEFGDEPLLIARETGLPVYVAAQRYEAGLLAEEDYAAPAAPAAQQVPSAAPQGLLHLLDDGFQHRQLYRDADIVLLDRNDWHESLLPAGNLREPLSALGRATIVAIPADDPELRAELESSRWKGTIWRLRRIIEVPSIAVPVAAFCGIARPDQFFAGLKAAGLQVAFQKAFPDHYRYTLRDVEEFTGAARAAGARALFTTDKDQVRLRSLAPGLPLHTARLRIEIGDKDRAIDSLLSRLRAPQPQPPL
jgi:tetraacyldisaccharide 4'-kinase